MRSCCTPTGVFDVLAQALQLIYLAHHRALDTYKARTSVRVRYRGMLGTYKTSTAEFSEQEDLPYTVTYTSID